MDDFRLPRDVRPLRYELRFDLDLERWCFGGRERVEIEMDRPAAEITLHAVEIEVVSARLEWRDRSLVADTRFDPEAETVTFCLSEPTGPGRARLVVDFRGEIRRRLRGIYRSVRDGERYVVTQFEAADARRAFPCFDEPTFKARFRLTLVIPPGLAAVANAAVESEEEMPDGRSLVRFGETPPISTYLVAFTVGPYVATPVAVTTTGVPVRVFLPSGLREKGLYARDAHVRALEYLEDYVGIPYPYGKCDAIGAPDFEAGAMENPGAITYRLVAIAADPEHASTDTLKEIFYTAAHELTHMWWGDLVTMAWWDDLWLNESFATFVGFKVVADLVPEWGMWRDFVHTLARPFSLDALASTHPISAEVGNVRQATERFDAITYGKGAAVVRMVEAFLGADDFRRGVRVYLERYRERNATSAEFWSVLDEVSGANVTAIAASWITEPGHPLVTVTVALQPDTTLLRLGQKRFFADPGAALDAPAQLWAVPLIIRYGSGSETREARVLLDREQQEVAIPGQARWVYPNGGGAGFYRVALDEAAFARLMEVAADVLSPEERLMLVDTEWALLKAGAIPVSQFLTLLDGLRREGDRAVLEAIGERLRWLSIHVVDDVTRPAFERFAADYYAPLVEALGWDPAPDEPADERLKRAAVIAAAGAVAAVPEVRAEARRRLDRYLGDRGSLDPDLASVVAGLAARDGDAALYERYLARKRQASADDPEEEERFLLALAAFELPQLVARTLVLTLTDEVRTQDRVFVLARLLGSRPARAVAWYFVRDRWDEIAATLDPMILQGLVRALGQLTPAPLAREVLVFLPAHADDQTRETIAQTTERLAIEAAACARLARELRGALCG